MKKRLSILLMFQLLMTMLPTSVFAAPSEVITTGQTIYFGKNGMEVDYAPIKWRVMESNNGVVTLLSDAVLGSSPYGQSTGDLWANSAICKYLNSTFLEKSFTTTEQYHIIQKYSTLDETFNSFTIRPEQTIVLPSLEEVRDGGLWGMNDGSRSIPAGPGGYSNPCWLRTPTDGSGNNNNALIVAFSGQPNYWGSPVSSSLYIRPALKLDTSSVPFTSITNITAPAAITNVPNGTLKDAAALGLEKVPVNIQTPAGNSTLKAIWDVQSCTYNPANTSAQTFSVKGKVKLPEGVVKLADGLSLDTSISVTVMPMIPPIVTTASLEAGTVGAVYSQSLAATGGTPTWSITSGSLPTGLVLNTATGVISGTPEAAGTFNFTVQAVNGVGNDTKALSININPAPVMPSIITDSLPNGMVGTAYSEALAATGDAPITWTITEGAVPSGLSLDTTKGVISGTPTTTASAISFTVKAENGAGSDKKDLSIGINAVQTVLYTVSFDSNGGNTISPMVNITSGQAIILPVPTKSNYNFQGWFDGTTQYTNGTPIIKNVTLIAKWTAIPTSGGGSDSGSGGGTNQTPALTPTKIIEELITKLTETQKQSIHDYFNESLPYTSINTSLDLEKLNQHTGNKFTEAQLKDILTSKELLAKLGINEDIAIRLIALTPIPNATFTDVSSSHWANRTIRQAAAIGLVAGMPDGSFAPGTPLQLADTCVFLDRVLLLNDVNNMKQSRSTVEKYITDKNQWAFAHIASIGSKLSESTLKAISELGTQPISRELLAQILYEVTNGELATGREIVAFDDTADSPYKDAIDYCIRVGLLNGTGNNHMSPHKALTRAELMTVLIRLNEKLK